MASTCGMWLTRFQDRSSVSTKTKFGRERSTAAAAWGGFRFAAGAEVQPTAATTATRRPSTAWTDFQVMASSEPHPGHRSHRFPEPTDRHAPRHVTQRASPEPPRAAVIRWRSSDPAQDGDDLADDDRVVGHDRRIDGV